VYSPNAGPYSPAGGGGVTVNVTVQSGVVVGSGGMQQLSQMVAQQVVQSFRGVAGMKI
jgi:hypothetical protein